jgi:hypothetical protein
MESQKPEPTDTWSKELGGGILTFTSEALGNPVAAYVHEAKFERGTSSYSMTRQSTEPLTRAEGELRPLHLRNPPRPIASSSPLARALIDSKILVQG